MDATYLVNKYRGQDACLEDARFADTFVDTVDTVRVRQQTFLAPCRSLVIGAVSFRHFKGNRNDVIG